jgi:hypothetical protein
MRTPGPPCTFCMSRVVGRSDSGEESWRTARDARERMPGCRVVATATIEDEVMHETAERGTDQRNSKEITLELAKNVKTATRTR